MQFQNMNSAVESVAISGPDAAAAAAQLASNISRLGTAIIAQHRASLDVALRSGLDRRQSLGVLSAIRAIATGVKGIEGRKTLLLFSEGFVVGPAVEDEFQSVIGLANRSQLAVYCIESQGLETRELSGNLVPRDELTSAVANSLENKSPRGGETVFDRARQVGKDMRDSVLRHLAVSTGGLLIRNTNDLSIGLERIDEEMRSYYVLSYRPKNDKLDGRFRQIRVSVKRPDLSVRARTGYYAMPVGFEMLNAAEYQLIEQARVLDASRKMPLFLRLASFAEGSRQYLVPVILEIGSESLSFDNKEGKRSAVLLIIGLVRDQAGNIARRFGGTVPVRVSEAEYDVLKRGTVSFVNHIQLPADNYVSVEVLVKDLGSGMLGSTQQAMYLRKPDAALGLSTILLAREVGKSLETAGQFLTVQGVKIMPSARCQFQNGDNLVFYFDIYNPQADSNKKTDISIELSLLHEGKLVNARLPRYHVKESLEAAARIQFARYLQLGGLPPGSYTLIVEANDSVSNQTARGQVAFHLVK
jgi:VWFA-related protein